MKLSPTAKGDGKVLTEPASKTLLAAIFASSEDAIIAKSLEGIIIAWNPSSEEIFGYTAAEVVGKPIAILFPPDRIHEEVDSLKRIRKGERVAYFETVRVRKDGRHIDVSVSLSPIKDSEEVITGVAVIVRDITERKQAEMEIIDSEHKFRAIYENANDAIYIVHKSRYIDCNSKGLDLLGIERSQLAGLTPFEDISGGVSEAKSVAKMSELQKKAEGGEAQLFDWTLHRKGGEQIDVEVSLTPFNLGRDVYLQAIARNVTERKRALRQISDQAALLDEAQDAIMECDLEDRILFWNRGAERLYGWTREEAMGKNVTDILGINTKRQEMRETPTVKDSSAGEIKLLAKDRREVTVDGRSTLVRDTKGDPKSVLLIHTDITEKKKIEAQFIRAQRLEIIGALAGGVAHDLNNVLAPILMSIELLKTTATDPESGRILESIAGNARRGADIVRQVLSLARGLEGEQIEIQATHLLKDLVRIIKDTFPKNIRLQVSIPDDAWTIHGDPAQIHQMLLNLCLNSSDAMPNGGILTLGIENVVFDEKFAAMNGQGKAGRYVTISVTDNGKGMPQEILNKIFEPFFTTKQQNKGAGLGLSTVMAIVKCHEGMINVYSEPGRRTTFKVYLPAIETVPARREEQKNLNKLPRGNGETILVVDDECSIVNITSETLHAFGYWVLTSTDGADALRVYLQHKDEIAVVLTDMMMPVMDGTALIHALTRINPAIKIVAMSGLDANEDVAMASEAAHKHFLVKPYTTATLLQTIQATLSEA